MAKDYWCSYGSHYMRGSNMIKTIDPKDKSKRPKEIWVCHDCKDKMFAPPKRKKKKSDKVLNHADEVLEDLELEHDEDLKDSEE